NGTTERYPKRRPRKEVPVYRVAVAAMFDDRRRLFIQRRPEDGLLGGLWELPGGKIRDGETAHEACLREVMEEVGVAVTIDEQLSVVRHAYSHFKVVITPFTCSVSGPMPIDHKESKWVEREDVGRFAMPMATRKVLRMLRWPN
ncbi:MAG: (deoxy)nucleoside triphosphate pyrophosphohydrolase, partial [Rhodothermales bacterium]|nr:(deoxy)nucleoside triphosphate pyrophosphohydrolase [Rhodothermales bacterium]